MDYTKLNKDLKNLQDIKLKKVSSFVPDDYNEEKDDDKESERIDIYDLGQEGLFLKVITTSDSYGTELGVSSIQFVKPVTRPVTQYEPV